MTSLRSFRVVSAAAALLVSSGAAAQDTLRSAQHEYKLVTVAEGLSIPWGLAFLPGGDILITERPGRLRVVRGGKLLPAAVTGVPRVAAGGQGGLLDVVAHPQFASNRYVYLTYSKPAADGKRNTTAVIRGKFENDALTDVQELLEANAWSEGQGHFGSRIAFDGKGYMFVTIGDRQVLPAGDLTKHPAQDLSVHNGKVLRLHDDGKVPTDNPFVGKPGALPEIWSYGHRNMQGIVVHPTTGDVWLHEHGPQGGDELNRVEAGRNYGWPVVGFGVMYRTGAAIHAGTMGEGFTAPVHIWVPSIGPSGLAYYNGSAFPGWKGSFLVGGLAGEQLVRLTMDGAKVTNVEQLVQRRGRIRDVRQGPDGAVYVAFESREQGATTTIAKLEPATRSGS